MESATGILTKYRTWTGDLPALVQSANAIQNELGLGRDGSGPNVRIFRHYQAVGCLGKPSERDGSKGVYGYRQLLEAVSVRVLLGDQWKLGKIGEVLAGMNDAELERLIETRSTNPSAVYMRQDLEMPGHEKPAEASVEETRPGHEALALIATFRTGAGEGKAATSSAPALGSQPTKGRTNYDFLPTKAPQTRQVTEHMVAPWLRVTVDEQALARTEPGAVLRTLADAVALLNTLKR